MMRLEIITTSLFRSTREYMEYFYLKGGIIEANAPNYNNRTIQICFRLDPD